MTTTSTQLGDNASRARRASGTIEDKPRLLFFYSATSGRDRRVEGFLAQVLQRNGNHTTFTVTRVEVATRPDLAARFRIRATPTLLVVHNNKVEARLCQPNGPSKLAEFLHPWLRTAVTTGRD